MRLLRHLPFQAQFHVLIVKRAEQGVEVAFHDGVEPVKGQFDSVVGDAILREIIGPDTLAAIAGPDLGAAFVCQLLLFLRSDSIQQARALKTSSPVRGCAAGSARPGFGRRSRRQMGDAHGRLGFVDLLASRPRGAVQVNPQLLRLDFDCINLVRLRQDGNRRGRGKDAAGGLGDGMRWTRVRRFRSAACGKRSVPRPRR
jgi:hypothetical protein